MTDLVAGDTVGRRETKHGRLRPPPASRPSMSRRLMHWEPTDEGCCHLIIDPSRVSLDEAVEEIVAAVEAEPESADLDRPPEERGDRSPGDDPQA